MSKMDVLARIRKTGEERLYPEKVFEICCDDPDNPLDFIKYVDLPVDEAPMPQQQSTAPQATHQQVLIDELIKVRSEKLALEKQMAELKAAIAPEEEAKKSVGRPKKEIA